MNAAYNAWGQCNYMNPVPFPNDPFMQHAYNARWEYLLDETGLYYCQNRYYDPGTGRFLNRDPQFIECSDQGALPLQSESHFQNPDPHQPRCLTG